MRITFIMEATEQIKRGETDPGITLELAYEILGLYDEEGLVTPKAEFSMIAAEAAGKLGDYEAAHRLARDSMTYWTIVSGKDSKEVRGAEQFAVKMLRHLR